MNSQVIKNIIAGNFSKAATTYDDYADIQNNLANRLIDIIPFSNMDKPSIIDIGCGTGFLTKLLINKYPDCKMTICDISEDMLEVCSKNINHDRLSILHIDAENLYKLKPKYDIIASNMTFQWYLDLDKTLKSYKSILNKNGILLFSTLMGKSFYEWYDSLKLSGAEISVPFENHTLPKDITYKIVEKINISKKYDDGLALLKTLKSIGAQSNIIRNQIPANIIRNACKIFNDKYNNTITYDIVMVVI